MKLTKQQQKEIMQVHEAYWAEYLKGNVEAMAALLDSSYTQVGSAESEVFYTKKEAVQFLHDTIKEVAGKLEMRNRKTSQESQDGLALVHEICDLYALDGKEWIFYSKFRATTLLREKKEGWKLIHQHSSFPDSKTDEGQNVAIDKISAENLQLKEAVKRRTTELEHKNRELEIEASLERIRAQAMAMRESADLLDIVVTLRNEFIALGHEAHYFWHMRWLPEKYEKAMTSGDGTRIGMVMELPRHIHGDIPLLAKWEKGKKHTVIYPMDVEAALNYVDKMVTLGDFQQVDPNAPTEEDIRHIGGLTFIMARTTHGEIGYSLPGVVEEVPMEDLELLVRFAGAFDLAHKRFEDLIKREQQAREVQVELALEKVRSRTMGMQKSEELKDVVKVIFDQLAHLSINAEHAGIVVDYEPKKDWHFWIAETQDIPAKITVPYLDLVWDRQFTEAKKKGQDFYTTLMNFEEKNSFYKVLLPHIEGLTKKVRDFYFNCPGLAASTVIEKDIGLYIENFSGTPYSREENDILKRFAKVFQQTYTRFLDLQKAEAQTREAQIEAALERVRSRSMAMHSSSELVEASDVMLAELKKLDIHALRIGICTIDRETEAAEIWSRSEINGKVEKTILGVVPKGVHPIFDNMVKAWKEKQPLFSSTRTGIEVKKYYEALSPYLSYPLPETFNKHEAISAFFFPEGSLNVVSIEALQKEEEQIMLRFANVFGQIYRRFLDLQKAEAQAREAKIEAALERVRSRSMAMHKSEELADLSLELVKQVQALGVATWFCAFNIYDDDPKGSLEWGSNGQGTFPKYRTPREGVFRRYYEAGQRGETLLINEIGKNECPAHYDYLCTLPGVGEQLLKMKDAGIPFPTSQIDHVAYFKYGYVLFITYEPSPESHEIFTRFAKVFEQTYTRFLDLKKAEAQAKEAQIEAALERVRSRSMAMHESGEMLEVIEVVSNQLKELKLNFDIVSFAQNKQEGDFTFWMTSRGQPKPILMEVPTMDSPVLKGVYNAKKTKTTFLADVFTPEENREWNAHLFKYSNLKYFPDAVKDFIMNAPGFARSSFLLENIDLYVGNYRAIPFTEEENLIFKRFAQVFEQAYTRFLDLQKAEAQAREAQIENALEKVRSRTMAMQKGEEVKDVVVLLYKELIALGVDNFVTCGYVEINEDINRQYTWVTSPGGDSLGLFYLPLTGDATFDERYAAWKKQQIVFHQTVAGEVRSKHLEFAITTFNSKEAEEMVRNQFPDPCVFYCFNFSHGYLHLVSGSKLKEEEESLLARFTRVFEQTYARFLDLKKAEAQAREAQIENALEKVRSRTMAMQKSHELPEAANNLFLQVQELGIPAWSAGYCIWETEDKKAASCNMSSEGEIQKSFILPTIGEGYNFYDPQKKGETFYIEELGGEALVKHYEFMRTLPKVGEILEELINAGLSLPTFQIFHILYFPHGYLMFITYEQVPEAHDIFKRFAKVFEQTYTRFLDLQKAEAQAREAQIEAALERARAQSMMMQHSDELNKTSEVFHDQLTLLGIDSEFSYLWLPDEEHNEHLFWATWQDNSGPSSTFKNKRVVYPLDKTEPSIAACYIAWESGNLPHVNSVPAEDVEDYFATWSELLDGVEKFKPELFPDGLYYVDAYMKYGCFGIVIKRHLSDNEQQILRRFSKEFERAYTRFLDLQKAEAQSRESQIEAALERVRSRTMGMQRSEELGDVATVLFKELNQLVDNLWTCGFVLCEKDRKEDEWWLSDQNGFIPAFYLPNVGDEAHANIYNAWKNGADYHTEQLEGEPLQKHYEWLMNIPVAKKIFDEMMATGFELPTWQKLHCAFFKTGYLVIITQVPCPEEEIFKRFAQVFDLTYTRFLDLQLKEEQAVKLVEEKQRLEVTLSDLRATQSQLVQSEKMASLGELTAGIAHEIQNPLNFVNNFSEVSKELLEEMMEEMQKGDVEEVKALAEDIIQNLDKIHHHGQRADGIVKGMLQHSRASSGEKEPTDLNVLADEYLRLAYHGLRAKDKSFNATLETHFDESIGKVDVMAQDMGRVILNLITNAFYAVQERKKQGETGYEPTVSIITKKHTSPSGAGGIEIRVNDNGNGIPDAIKEKIFQPFFTTKPTGQGTGLGLSMSYDIITKGHGGSLEVTSEEGIGSEFIITLIV